MRKLFNFENLMNLREAGVLLAYLPVHIFLLPALIIGFSLASGYKPGAVFADAVYFGVGLLVALLFARGFLRRSFDAFLDNMRHCFVTLLFGVLGVMALSQISLIIMILIDESLLNSSEFLAIEISGTNAQGLLILSVGAVPVVEETLFRGFIFGSLRKKSRVVAYALSIFVYVMYNVWQSFFGGYSSGQIVVLIISHLPEALMLAWCYERSGSIWTSILLSAAVSAISLAPFLY